MFQIYTPNCTIIIQCKYYFGERYNVTTNISLYNIYLTKATITNHLILINFSSLRPVLCKCLHKKYCVSLQLSAGYLNVCRYISILA